jgi:hypothetical protein
MKILYGLTHTLEGVPIVREARSVKIGIGLPKGKAVHVWIESEGDWRVLVGKQETAFRTREEAEGFYNEAKTGAPERKYPERLSYFTFTNVSPSGAFEPDFEAIEQHGPKPRELDVVFLKEEPFNASYQMWTAAELKCEGDGMNARRVVTLGGDGRDQRFRDIAAQAMSEGKKHFDIEAGCRMFDCPFAKGEGTKSALCKPHGRLAFQLVRSPRLGSTAYFDTTGFRSVSQIFSSLQTFLEISGRGDVGQGHVAGIPFKMVLRPYRVNFQGQPGTQYAVALEFRAKDALAVKGELIGHADAYQSAGLLPASTSEPIDITSASEIIEEAEIYAAPPEAAVAMASEFFPEQDGDEFSNGEGEETNGVRMPRRKETTAEQPVSIAQAPKEPVANVGPTPVASEGYVEALASRAWKCLPAQRQLVLKKIELFLVAGGTAAEIRDLLVAEFNVESPAQLEAKQIGAAQLAIQRAQPRGQRSVSQPEPQPTKRQMNEAAISAQAPVSRGRAALFE